MELSSKSLTIGSLFIVFVFQLPHCNAFYLQYIAFFSSLKFLMFSGYSFPALYTMSFDEISFAENVTCKHLCTKTFVGGDKKDNEQLDALKKGMSLKSKRHWILDVRVVPSSIKHSNNELCNSGNPLEIPKGGVPFGQSLDVKYTYSVKFIRNDNMKWSSRWDYIFRSMPFSNLHWIPLLYSILAVLFIILVPVIIITAIYRDSKSYKMGCCFCFCCSGLHIILHGQLCLTSILLS